ncbi:HVA22/TB2/DP1 family protein [archaeon]|nr:MAG: HVA22/TB2/DP1 family protein [archaeon]
MSSATALNSTLNSVRSAVLQQPALKHRALQLEEKTGVNVEYVVLAAALLLALSLFSGVGAATVSNLIGFLYPAVRTLGVLEGGAEAEGEGGERQRVLLLAYWVVFSALLLLERFSPLLLFWLPFYYPIKVSLLLWCALPQYEGAHWVSQHVLRPLLQDSKKESNKEH